METGHIAGATHNLGKPKGWDDKEHGTCGHLHVRIEEDGGVSRMTSAWYPLPEEIERIKLGAPVYLTIAGKAHPPVSLTVGDIPK